MNTATGFWNTSATTDTISLTGSTTFNTGNLIYDTFMHYPKDVVEKKQDPKTFYEEIQLETKNWLDW